MQGVRTNKGCINCRRRKKGCDFQVPTCGRCERLGALCRYEEREWIFLNRTRDSPNTARGASPSTDASQRSLARTESTLQVDAQFWHSFLPQEDPALDGSIGGIFAASWIPTVRAMAEESEDVRTALQACTFAGLGWIREDPAFIRQATELYARALQTTNHALQDPVLVLGDNVLACCRLLSLFEMFCRTPVSAAAGQNQLRDWRSHVEGSCRIVRLRGLQRHLSGHSVHLYDGVRMTAVIHGFGTRRPNIFTMLSWDMPKLTMRDELFDLAVVIPSIFEQLDRISADMTDPVQPEGGIQILDRSNELIESCLAICHSLRYWEMKILDICRDRQAEQRLDFDRVDSSEMSLFDICTFHGNGFFFVCTQYWAICTSLYSSIRQFHKQVSSYADNSSLEIKIPQLPDWVEPEPHAFNIARVTAYYFRPQAGIWGGHSAMFPVGTALLYFARTNRRGSAPFQMMKDAFAVSNSGTMMREFLQRVVGE